MTKSEGSEMPVLLVPRSEIPCKGDAIEHQSASKFWQPTVKIPNTFFFFEGRSVEWTIPI